MIYSHSQNFLFKKELVEKLIDNCQFKNTDTVVDIGAGSGIITDVLSKKVTKVKAFEIDNKYFEILKNKFGNNSKVELERGDFLIHRFNMSENPLQVFSNIPYNQTTKITKKILLDEEIFENVYLVVQKQAAERLMGIKEGLLYSLFILNKYEPKIEHEFKYSDFKPVARVKSVLISFKRREQNLVEFKDDKFFKDFISFLVMQQRPTILERLEKLMPARTAIELLKNSGIKTHASLYDIEKSKFFTLFQNFKLNNTSFHSKVEKSYQNYLRINESNVKTYRTRPAPKNEVHRPHHKRS